MPKEKFTPEEEQTIEALVSQFSLNERLPGPGVNATVSLPPFSVAFPPSPQIPYSGSISIEAPTRDEALAQMQSQIAAQITTVKVSIDDWIAGLNNHHRYFALYQEAFSRAKERF